MTARKTTAAKTPSSTRKNVPRARNRRANGVESEARSGALLRDLDVAKFATPVGAALAAGALAAAAYFFKDNVGDVLGDTMQFATKRGAKLASATSRTFDDARGQVQDAAHTIAEKMSIDPLLAYAGLARRSTLHTIAGPAIGVACGFVAGSVLTHLFGETVLATVKEVISERIGHSDEVAPEMHHEPQAPTNETHANGSMHGGLG